MPRTLLTILVLLSVAAPAAAERVQHPDPESPQFALLESLKLVRDGHYEVFITQWCHPGLLCATPDAFVRLQREILPSVREKLTSCLSEGGAIEVVDLDGDVMAHDAQLVFSLDCGAAGRHTVQIHRYRAKWWIVSI